MSNVENFKPSHVTKAMWDSPWQNSECETIATNIRKLSQFSNGDAWVPFTWDEYCNFCSHRVTESERGILSKFVLQGYLKLDGNAYHFTEKMIKVYMMYA